MARARVHSIDGKTLVELPQDVADELGLKEGSEVEFRLVGNRVAAVLAVEGKEQKIVPAAPAPPAAIAPAAPQPVPIPNVIATQHAKAAQLSGAEIAVLKKVAAVKYAGRSVEYVERLLSDEEKKLYKEMFKKRVLYEAKMKGRATLVGVSNDYFEMAKSKPSSATVPAPAPAQQVTTRAVTVVTRPKVRAEDDPLLSPLVKDGFLTIENERQAGDVTYRLKESGFGARGVRGFDKRFYVVANARLDELEPKILNAVELPKTLKQLSIETGAGEELVKACVEVLKEDGKLVEKKKDLFVGA